MQTLYVSRPVILADAQKIQQWAISSGFKTTLDPSDMHVTVAFSKEPVDWNSWKVDPTSIVISPGNRTVAPLGDKGAVVLKVQSSKLQTRWQDFINKGASWDYPSYQPHISITYDGKDVDLSKIEPYNDPITLSGEKWDVIQLDWDKKIKET